jgi:thaumarchaeosortase
MNESQGTIRVFLSSPGNRVNAFYALALAPFILLTYYYANWPPTLLILMYAFILIVMKRQKLLEFSASNTMEKVTGVLLIVASFFVYFIVSPFFSNAVFYGVVNYALCLLGLLLLFYNARVLKEAFTPTFFMIASVASPIISLWLEPHLTFVLPYFTQLIVSIMTIVGFKATLVNHDSNILILNTPHGSAAFQINWTCMGFESASIFAILLVVTLFDEPNCDRKTKTLWIIGGLLGTFVINIIRVINILAAEYFYGGTVSSAVHSVAGYILFIAWITVFLYVFSKRKTLTGKLSRLVSIIHKD